MDNESFESLTLEEQARIIQQSPIKEKGNLVLHSQDPARLTQSFSHEELYLVLKGMDVEEKSELIRCANLGQLFFVSDIECWRKDRIDPAGFVHWLEILRHADEQKLFQWLLAADHGATVSGFMKIIRVLKPEWEYAADELIGDEPYFTLDNFYYVLVREEDMDTVRRALSVLYENHQGRYVALMESILGENEDELEEEAYRRREARLADYGFPEKERAFLIYRPISQEEFDGFPLKKATDVLAPERLRASDWKIENYPVLWKSDVIFLDEVLRLFWEEPPAAADGIREELVWLSNKVVAAKGIERVSEETVRFGVERARSFVNLGLEILTGRDLDKAGRIVRERWLEIIFRRAVTCLMDLLCETEAMLEKYWKGTPEAFLHFLGLPYEMIIQGLLRQVPQYYASQVAGDPAGLRDFRTLDELQRTRRAVDQIRGVLAFAQKEAPAFFRRLTGEMERNPDFERRLFDFLQAVYIGFVLHGKPGHDFPTAAQKKSFFDKAFETVDGRPVLVKAQKDAFLDRFFEAEARGILGPLWSLVFDQMEDEFRTKYRLGILKKEKRSKGRSEDSGREKADGKKP